MTTADREGSTPGPGSRLRLRVESWPVWELRRRLVPILTVELTALALLVLGISGAVPLGTGELQAFLLICLVGMLHTEIARDVERVRRRMTGDDLHVDLGSVWFFAAAALLAPGFAALATVVVHSHLWLRSAHIRAPLHRQVFNSATMAISSFASSAVMAYACETYGIAFMSDGATALVLLLGMLVFLTVNSALVAGAVAVSMPHANAAQMLGQWHENLLEIATLSLGALVAVAYVVNPWLILFALPPLLVLHKAVLVRHLEEAASTDSKTGLLNAAAWHTQAERALRRTSRNEGPRGLLVLDLDHFKAVNDSHGHIAGDHVLAAVARAMRGEVRDRDLVGRFGGEEFVVLLAGLEGGGTAELQAVAERIRRRVEELHVEIPTPDGPLTVAGLSVSIGGALQTGAGGELRSLLQIADAALFTAKRDGRNVVRMGLPVPVQQSPVQAQARSADGPREA